MPKRRRRPRLISNWRAVLRYAWSVKLMILAAVLTGLETVLPLLGDLLPIPQGCFAAASFLVVMGAFAARFFVQQKISGDE